MGGANPSEPADPATLPEPGAKVGPEGEALPRSALPAAPMPSFHSDACPCVRRGWGGVGCGGGAGCAVLAHPDDVGRQPAHPAAGARPADRVDRRRYALNSPVLDAPPRPAAAAAVAAAMLPTCWANPSDRVPARRLQPCTAVTRFGCTTTTASRGRRAASGRGAKPRPPPSGRPADLPSKPPPAAAPADCPTTSSSSLASRPPLA